MGRLEASNVLFVPNYWVFSRKVRSEKTSIEVIPPFWADRDNQRNRTPWIEWISWWKVRHHETSFSFSWDLLILLISVWIWSRANISQTKTTHLSTSTVAPCRLQEGNVLRDFCSQTHQELTQQLGPWPIVIFPIEFHWKTRWATRR